MHAEKTTFIEFMVRAGVLQFGEFVTKSGRSTPFFINTGNYRSAEQISKLGEYYAGAIRAHFVDTATLLFGPAYKGIPLVVSTCCALYSGYGTDCSFAFNRKEAKDHGEGGTIIGKTPGNDDSVIIVEDVITAGTSIREVIPLIRAHSQARIAGLVVSVDRQEKTAHGESALQALAREFGIRCVALVTIDEIVSHLYNRAVDGSVVIDDEIKRRIDRYRETYGVSFNEKSK